MKVVAEIAPLALLALIVALIVRSRVGALDLGALVRRGAGRYRSKKKRATILHFDANRLDDDLNALLRKRR